MITLLQRNNNIRGRDNQFSAKILDLYVYFIFTLSTNAFFPLFNNYSLQKVLWYISYVFAIFLVINNLNKVRLILIKNYSLTLLFIYTLLSSFWSVDQIVSINGIIPLIFTFINSIIISNKYSIEELLIILSRVFYLIILSSFILAIFLPTFGVEQIYNIGDWRGVFHQKNILGRTMFLSILIFFIRFSVYKHKNISLFLYLLAAFYLLIMSGSTTSLSLIIVILISLVIFIFTKRINFFLKMSMISFSVSLSILITIMFIENKTQILGFLGKDSTLTGRVDLWNAIYVMIKEKPLLGYGYNAFWNGKTGLANVVFQKIGFEATFSHNGYLELLLNIGLLGLIGFLIIFTKSFFYASFLLLKCRDYNYLLPFLYLVFTLIYNFTENTILISNYIFWILFIIFHIKIMDGKNRYNQLVGGK